MATNITWHGAISRAERFRLRRQPGFTVWFTGLSASGKSTIAAALEESLLRSYGLAAYRLDGDNIRFGLNRDLGFSEKDRNENIRRIGEVARLFADSGTIAIASFISPYRADRDSARRLHQEPGKEAEAEAGAGESPSLRFIEVHVDISVEAAEARDPKGLYKKARAGLIPEFTGVSAPYEVPENAEITIRSAHTPVQEAVAQILDYLKAEGLLGQLDQPAQ